MPRLVYLNGKFLPDVEAHISIFDRGFLFSDAVYEVTAVIDKKLVSWEGHLNRLRYSLKELNIDLQKQMMNFYLSIENLLNRTISLRV